VDEEEKGRKSETLKVMKPSCGPNRDSLKFNFFLELLLFMFLYYFDIIILQINFLKIKKYYFKIFIKKY